MFRIANVKREGACKMCGSRTKGRRRGKQSRHELIAGSTLWRRLLEVESRRTRCRNEDHVAANGGSVMAAFGRRASLQWARRKWTSTLDLYIEIIPEGEWVSALLRSVEASRLEMNVDTARRLAWAQVHELEATGNEAVQVGARESIADNSVSGCARDIGLVRWSMAQQGYVMC
jgi:hypothetical protein